MPESAPRRHSAASLVVGLSALAATAWAYLFLGAVEFADGSATNLSPLSEVDPSPWSLAQLLSLFAMWAVMMAAMMIPGAAPAVLVYQRFALGRRQSGRAYAAWGWFVAGYLTVWSGFSVAATLAQSALHAAMAMSTAMVLSQPLPVVALLAAAGAYQLSSLKGRCLSQCRSPLDLFLQYWSEGRTGAAAMGARHGLWCVGCCWLLMSVLFAVGVMNLAWIGVLTLLVIAEKVLPQGQRVARVSGWLLLGWAAWRMLDWLLIAVLQAQG